MVPRKENEMGRCRMNKKDLTDLVITAFEGGIDYWCFRAREYVAIEKVGDKTRYRVMTKEERAEWRDEYGCGPYTNADFWEGKKRGYALWFEEGEKPVLLTMTKLRKAFDNEYFDDELGKKVLKRFANPGEADAWDADTLVQIAVFGEVVYG